MRFRFRKSFNIFPGFKGTVSKKGVSLNFRAGLFSKTWGTRGTSTTVDMPGTSGMFWRSEKRRNAANAADFAEGRQRGWALLSWIIIMMQFVAGLVYIYFIPASKTNCHSGSFTAHLIYMAVVAISYSVLSAGWPKAKSFLGFIIMLGMFWVQWQIYHAFIMPGCAT